MTMTLYNPRHAALVLVVVGIGAALYKISLPLRESGLKSSCQSNLKQMGLAMMQYTRDYDEQFMLAPNWKHALTPYGLRGSSQLLSCPKTTRDYAYNSNLSENYMEAVSKPAALVLFYEPSNSINADIGKHWAASGIHGDGSNVCFTDGHVKWLQLKPAFWQASLLNKSEIVAKRAKWWRDFKASEKRRLDWIQKHAKKP